MQRRLSAWLWVWFSVALSAFAQESQPAGDPLDRATIEKTIRFIASDDMAGRDTPSLALERTADYLAAEVLKAAGLTGGAKDGSFFHRYKLAGQVIDSATIKVSVKGGDAKKPLVLAPDQDIRLWRGAAGFDGTDVLVLRKTLGVAAPNGVGEKVAATAPVFIEMEETSPLWKAAAGKRTILGPRGRGSNPTFFVRKGVLPDGDLTAVIHVPKAEAGDAEVRNVVAVLPGKKTPSEYVMFSAHYDHIGVNIGAADDVIFNGADDDGTGTTAVLSIARAAARRAEGTARSLLFVFFSGEEKGLLGSQEFAKTPPVDLTKVVADLNLEMLGRPPAGKANSLWVTGRDLSDFEAILADGLDGTDVGIWSFGMQGQLFMQSDNWSLAAKGVVAHSISASELHRDYHGLKDEVDRLDLDHMTKVIGAIFKAGVHFADVPARPKWNEKGQKTVQRASR